MVLRQTETIRLQKFSSLILKVRCRLNPLLFIVMTATHREDAPDRQADHDRLFHQPTFMRYKKGLGSACLSSPPSLTRDASRLTSYLERAMGFEPHSVAGSALKSASRLLLRGPAPSHAPLERGAPLSKSPVVGSNPQERCDVFGAGDGI